LIDWAIRWVIFAALAAFVPLVYYLAVVGGLLPYGAILLITIRNLSNSSIVLFGLLHLVPYGALLFWVSGAIAGVIGRRAPGREWLAATLAVLVLVGVGALPIFGAAHGQIRWASAYALYVSGSLR
jgi:hypothetical protein